VNFVHVPPVACFPCLTARCGHPEHASRRTLTNLAGGNLVPMVTYAGGTALCEDCAIREAEYLPEPVAVSGSQQERRGQ
jgi:hypothetical protein